MSLTGQILLFILCMAEVLAWCFPVLFVFWLGRCYESWKGEIFWYRVYWRNKKHPLDFYEHLNPTTNEKPKTNKPLLTPDQRAYDC